MSNLSKAFRKCHYLVSSARKIIQALKQSIQKNMYDSTQQVNVELLSSFYVLDNMLGIIAKLIAGLIAQTQELKRLYIEHKEREASYQALICSSHTFLDSTFPSFDVHRAVTASFTVSMKCDHAMKNSLDNTRNSTQVRKDYVSIVHTGTLKIESSARKINRM